MSYYELLHEKYYMETIVKWIPTDFIEFFDFLWVWDVGVSVGVYILYHGDDRTRHVLCRVLCHVLCHVLCKSCRPIIRHTLVISLCQC